MLSTKLHDLSVVSNALQWSVLLIRKQSGLPDDCRIELGRVNISHGKGGRHSELSHQSQYSHHHATYKWQNSPCHCLFVLLLLIIRMLNSPDGDTSMERQETPPRSMEMQNVCRLPNLKLENRCDYSPIIKHIV